MKQLSLLLVYVFLQTGPLLQGQWTSLGSGIDAAPRQIFSMHAVNDQVIWAITGFNPINFTPVFEYTKTTDGGATWQPGLLDIDANLYHFDIFALDDQTAWITAADEKNPISGKIYKTTDGGLTWQPQQTAFTGFNRTPASIYFWNANEGISFGATCYDTYNDQIAVYTTSDGGNTWDPVAAPNFPPQLPGEGICFWSGNSNYAVIGDTFWFFSSKNRIFRSFDRGLTWDATDVDLGDGLAISIAFKDDLNGIVLGFQPNGGARTTDGGNTWTPISIRPLTQVSEIEYIPGTAGTYLIQDGDAFGANQINITYDDGDNWELLSAKENFSCFEFLSPTVGFAGGAVSAPDQGGIYRWESNIFVTPVKETQILADFPNPFLELFPVPGKAALHIQFPDGWPPAPFQVAVFDTQGRLIREEQFSDRQSLNIEDLTPGIYIFRAFISGQVYSGRFIKQ